MKEYAIIPREHFGDTRGWTNQFEGKHVKVYPIKGVFRVTDIFGDLLFLRAVDENGKQIDVTVESILYDSRVKFYEEEEE